VAVKYNEQEQEKERLVKVIFIEDVPDVARAGETRVVADGYGRNFLLPRRLAVLANSEASAMVEARLKKRERQMAQTEAEMTEMAARLNGMEITLKAKAGAKERLYGSVTSADIAEALSQSAGQVVDKRKVELAEPIHQLGSYEVTVRFTHDITAVIRLTVAAEGVAEAKVEAEVPAEVAVAKAEKPEAKKVKKTRAKKVEEAEAEAGEKVEKKAAKKTKEAAAEVETKAAEAEAEKSAKKEKKTRAKKKVEKAGEKDAEPGK
jgi:large subunit ribosomal protein L9